MTISSPNSQSTPLTSSQTTPTSSESAASSSQSGSTQAASQTQSSSAGASPEQTKRIISEVTITVDGITTTTITYSDGTTEKIVSGRALGISAIKLPSNYGAKPTLPGDASDAASQRSNSNA